MQPKQSTERRTQTFRDILSQLTYLQACKLLGPRGAEVIREGGRFDVATDQVQISLDAATLEMEGARVRLVSAEDAPNKLRISCSLCGRTCEHMGVLISLILEEKTALGLARVPVEDLPLELLNEEQLHARALHEREERARTDRMKIQASEPQRLWTDYLVTSSESGKTYRVALRGKELGQSYCSCPDFRSNTLGTCKHVLHVLRKLRSRFSAAAFRKTYASEHVSVYLRYGAGRTLHLSLPGRMGMNAQKLLGNLRDRPIDDVEDLVLRITRLGRLGEDVTIYPDAEEYMQQKLHQHRMEKLVAEMRRNPRNHPLRKSLLKVDLLPYQLDGIAFAVGAGRAILADDMGLGKTIQGVGVAELLARESGVGRVLVVCPATLKSQWKSEIERFSDRDAQLVIGTASERRGQYQSDCFFTICNYEQVLRDLLAIEQVRWDLIVLDEAQRIKNWESKTSRVLKGLRSRFALALSGTPLENRLDELYSVIQFVDDRRLGPAFRFFHRHRVVDEKGKLEGYRNLAELREAMRPVLLRRTRQSVMQELPPRTTEIVRIEPTGEQLDMHDQNLRLVMQIVNKPYLSEMDLLRLQKLLLLCRMSANGTALVDKKKPGHSSKLEELEDLLDRLAREERKIVLFSEWTTMLDFIEPLARKAGLPFVRLDGSVPQRQRHALVQRFHQDASCRLFLATNAGSTGLNLQVADTVVNCDLPWNPAVLEQRISRAHRMGQKKPVQVYLLVTTGTIEERLLATLSAKHNLALAALDPDSDVDWVEIASGMSELKRRLEVLVGTKKEAPIDQSEQRRSEQELERIRAQKERVAVAGGQLFDAALRFLGEMLPAPATKRSVAGSKRNRGAAMAQGQASDVVQQLHQQLLSATDRDESGRLRLQVVLPDESSLQSIAAAMAAMLGASPSGMAAAS